MHAQIGLQKKPTRNGLPLIGLSDIVVTLSTRNRFLQKDTFVEYGLGLSDFLFIG